MARERRQLPVVSRLAAPLAAALATTLVLAQPVAAGPGELPQAPVEAAALTLASVSPGCGPTGGGTTVILNGTGFFPYIGTGVRFGSAYGLLPIVWSPTMMTVVTPPGAAGAVNVTVEAGPIGTAVLPAGFTYADPCPAAPPAITTVSPGKVRARGATFTLTLTGSDFVNGAFVYWEFHPSVGTRLNAAAKATTFVSATELRATIVTADIPLPGTALVRVVNPDGQNSNNVSVAVAPGWKLVGEGDFDGDGRSDLVWESSEGYLALWFMNGYTQTASTLLHPSPVATDGWHVKAVGDLNGDGRPDLVWENTSNGNVAAWYMNGTTLADAVLLAPGAMLGGWHVVAAGDLDGDHYAEVIVQNDNGLIGAWFNRGQDPRLLYPVPVATGGWSIAGAADVNADGMADLIWQMPSGGAAVWLMNGASQARSFVALDLTLPDCRWAAIGDLDRDGVPDLTLAYDDGKVRGFLMNQGFVGAKASGDLVPGRVYSRTE